MIKAILLDLDNTLLNNVDEVFVPQYLSLADQYFASQWQHSDMAATLRRVIGALSTPRDVRQTNTAVAEAIVAGAAQRSAEDVQAAFGDFYRTVYPSLRRCVEPIPLAAELVRYLRKLDCALVIATNPLYPAEAIYQRLEWAGLSSDPADYAFVTTSDNTHFIKPDPAYFAEIIARVGVEPDETLMLGDSLSSDIEPAACLGINTYHLTPSAQGDHAGTLADFYHLITATDWLQRTRPTQLKPEAIHPQLRGNLGALFGLLSEVKDQQWDQYPDPEEWSILEVVCHLLLQRGERAAAPSRTHPGRRQSLPDPTADSAAPA